MANSQLLHDLVEAEALLKQTKVGYKPDGPYWKRGMPMLWDVRVALGTSADGGRLAEAHGLLKDTEKGYDPQAPRWKSAMRLIDTVEVHLAPPRIPDLGPVIKGDKSLMLWTPTHETAGLFNSPHVPKANGGNGSHYPAFDSAFGRVGAVIVAPEDLRVTGQSSAAGADAFYALGVSKLAYWFGHLQSAPATNRKFEKGEPMGKVARIAQADGGPHFHCGVDGRRLMGRDFRWGRNGTGPDYTFGSPTYGRQLALALAA